MRSTGARGRKPSPYPRPAQTHQAPRTTTSRSRRRYIAGFSAAAVTAAVAVGLMSTGNAFAEGEGNEVVFNGRCGLLLGKESTPDKESLSVEKGQKVTFVNNLGADATLLVGGQEFAVEEGAEYPVPMEHAAEALMAPDCPLLDPPKDPQTMTVSVTEPPAEEKPDKPSDGGSDDNGTNSGSGDGSQGDSGSDVGVPSDGDAPELDPDDPAAKDKVPPPDGEKDGDEAAAGDGSDSTDSGTTAGENAPAEQVEAVDASSIKQPGSSGLLALLATVCLVGVAVAAIRTMMNNRAMARG